MVVVKIFSLVKNLVVEEVVSLDLIIFLLVQSLVLLSLVVRQISRLVNVQEEQLLDPATI